MSSDKTIVIEKLFFRHWDANAQCLKKTIISLEDVASAIRDCNNFHGTSLSDKNPANFFKDFMRGARSSKNWPAAVAELRFTAVQRTGDGDAFEFIPYKNGQLVPFTDAFALGTASPVFPIQSISLPLVTKTLGRTDEAWLIQTAINLRVIETHFAIASSTPMLELSHLQMNIKLRKTEIDALFLGKMGDLQNSEQVLVTCEAKKSSDPFIPEQIINQVQATFAATDTKIVIPIGLKAIRNKGFYLTEFKAVRRVDASKFVELQLECDAIYELMPPVRGI